MLSLFFLQSENEHLRYEGNIEQRGKNKFIHISLYLSLLILFCIQKLEHYMYMTTISPNRNIIIISAFLNANREAKVECEISPDQGWGKVVSHRYCT